MGRTGRTRRGLAWVGAGVCVLLVAVFVVSLLGSFVRLGSNGMHVGVSRGAVQVVQTPTGALRARGWRWDRSSALAWPRWVPEYRSVGNTLMVNVPLWIPLVVIGSLSAWLWWSGRSQGPGRCAACGYPLDGIGCAVCPECGERGSS